MSKLLRTREKRTGGRYSVWTFILIMAACSLLHPFASAQSGKDKKAPTPLAVKLNVLAADSTASKLVLDVEQKDFQVFEDDVAQTLTSFKRNEGPLSYCLLIDNSGSVRPQLDEIIKLAQTIVINNVSDDETMLIRFINSEAIQTVQTFTSDKELLMRKLDSLYVEGGDSAINDAVYLAAETVAEHKKSDTGPRRRAVILITDGEERASFYKLERVLKRLRELDVPVFAIGFTQEIGNKIGIEKARDYLNTLAQETGGDSYFPASPKDFPEMVRMIILEMHATYTLGYNSTNPSRDGKFRKVRVEIAAAPGRDKRVAIVRSGYTAPRKQ